MSASPPNGSEAPSRATTQGSIQLEMPAAGANGLALHAAPAASPSPAPAASASAAATSSNGNGKSSHSHPSLVNKPTFLESPSGLRFLIMDAPNDQVGFARAPGGDSDGTHNRSENLPSYIEVLKKKQVVVVTRVCDPTYSAGPLLAAGIKVLEIPFPDGDPPPQPVVDRWLALVNQVFKDGGRSTTTGVELHLENVPAPAIAIHCVAGLGRAPVMVAIALVENGMEPFDAIAFIRKKRRGAINARQLKFIEAYVPQRAKGGCCSVQ